VREVRVQTALKSMRIVLLAGVAALALSACASNRASMADPIETGSIQPGSSSLAELAARYKARPRDKVVIIYYAAALRAAGQADQAVSVLENGLTVHRKDLDLRVAYAKALTAAGRFEQALNVADDAIDPASPNWNALLVKGAILDQNGKNADARQLYTQALLIAPNEASLEANMGLSFAMTNQLDEAEAHLRKAVSMRGANSQIRQNLALVIGLQGRFDECRAMFARELPPDQVEANMAYIRALLTQQNRWDLIKGAD
jgi:Flp pilus assembly protein TadD